MYATNACERKNENSENRAVEKQSNVLTQ